MNIAYVEHPTWALSFCAMLAVEAGQCYLSFRTPSAFAGECQPHTQRSFEGQLTPGLVEFIGAPTRPFVGSAPEDARAVFDALDQGLCTIEVLFDHAGNPVDYVFLEVNAAFELHTGLSDAVGRSMRELRPDHEEHWFRIYGEIARTGVPRRFDAEAKALNRWFDVHAFRIGEPSENKVVILFDDITQQRLQEEQLSLLNKEVDHRARNMLALVAGLVRLTNGASVEDYKRSLLGRLKALQRSNDRLSNAASMATGYQELIRAEMAAYQIGERVRISGPAVRLTQLATRYFAMGLHELATNAVKHGALSVSSGVVDVTWDIAASAAGGILRTTWVESGGPAVSVPIRAGVGSNIIARSLKDQLDGELRIDWRRQGLYVEFCVPVSRAVEQG